MLKEPNSLKWTYHNKFDYHHDELTQSGMRLFEIEEYEWKYMLKSTRRRYICLHVGCWASPTKPS